MITRNRTRLMTVLLFSLSLILFTSCSSRVSQIRQLQDLYNEGQYEGVISLSTEYLAETMEPIFLLYKGLAFGNLNDPEEALSTLELYVAMAKPEDAGMITARMSLIVLAREKHDWELVRKHADHLVAAGHSNQETLEALYVALSSMGSDRAAGVFEQIAPGMDAKRAASLAVEGNNTADIIISALTRWKTEYPYEITQDQFITVFTQAARILAQRGNAGDLITLNRELVEATEAFPMQKGSYIDILGDLYSSSGDRVHARRLWIEARTLNKDLPSFETKL